MHGTTLNNLEDLRKEYDRLRPGKDSLLVLLEEAELPEAVYNSNAIENSTLTLDQTEKILMENELPAHHTQREVFEAINLARVTEYFRGMVEKKQPLTVDRLLLAHRTLLSHIDDKIAGRFRQDKEYVRVGKHIAPPPRFIPDLIETALEEYHQDNIDPLQRMVQFHLEFERVHPFLDGNGRVGRALLNVQCRQHGYPPVIVRNKEKKDYYHAFGLYDMGRSTKEFEKIFALLLKESLHKRIAYLRSDEIVLVSDVAKEQTKHSPQSLANAAKKQSMPAFRERGKWKVGREMFGEWMQGE